MSRQCPDCRELFCDTDKRGFRFHRIETVTGWRCRTRDELLEDGWTFKWPTWIAPKDLTRNPGRPISESGRQILTVAGVGNGKRRRIL